MCDDTLEWERAVARKASRRRVVEKMLASLDSRHVPTIKKSSVRSADWAAGVVQRGLERRRPVGVRVATASRRELKPPRCARSAMPEDGVGGARIK